MALTILNANFTQNGVPIGTNNVYLDLEVKFPYTESYLEVKIQIFDFTGNVLGGRILKIDGIDRYKIDYSSLVTSDFWNDISAGSIHNKIIELLEIENPLWATKINKIIPS